jgi:hypothetical protein
MRRLLPILIGAVALGGCGGKDSVTIDHTVVEKGIEAGVAQQQHVLSTVSCPPKIVAKKGREFVCTATLASGRQVPVTVTATDDKGSVSYAGFNGFRNGRLSG